MTSEKYRHYFDIDPEYFTAVNPNVISKHPEVWKKFYPHEEFIRLIRNTVNVIDRREKLSIWVEGAYGTGKSHAVLTLKKLLDGSEDDVREYFDNYGIDRDLRNNLLRIKRSGKILTVHRYGSSNIKDDNDLVLAIQESVTKALSDAGIENKAGESMRESVIRYLEDPENKQSFGIYVKGSYSTLFGGDDVDDIIRKLKTYHDEGIRTLMDKIFRVARERQIKAFTMTAGDLCEWLKEVIHANGLTALVFIWDEFTNYLENNGRNLTGFQEICELSETEPFCLVLVTHLSSGLFREDNSDYKKINDRFIKPHNIIKLPDDIAFKLMGAAMRKNRDEVVLEDWKDITDDLASRTRGARNKVKIAANTGENEILNVLPAHPYTALVLRNISYTFESNQRSMFDFIKNDQGDEIKGFQWFIDNYGPEDENPLLTVDLLWDFFYEKGRDSLAPDVRSVLDYYVTASRQNLAPDEDRILKAILLLEAISKRTGESVDMFIPNEKNLDLAFEGSDLGFGAATRCAEKLVRDRVLYKKQLGGGNFSYSPYVNEVSGPELDKFKEEIDRKTTANLIGMPLRNDNSTVSDAVSFDGALKLRYKLSHVGPTDFDSEIRRLRNVEAELGNKIPAVVCYAKNDDESAIIERKIKGIMRDGSFHVVIIDATVTPFRRDDYEQFRNESALSLYQRGRDANLSAQYDNNAKDVLRRWKNRIANGEFIVYSQDRPQGERAVSFEALSGILREINNRTYPDCLEGAYNVISTMYAQNPLKLGVECGATRTTKSTFRSGNAATKLETALAEAWNDPVYWETRPNLLISKIKLDVDNLIKSKCEVSGRVSIRDIYDMLKAKPYGFMPCNLSAFIMGFVLREYVDGSYSWSDNITNEPLSLEKLKEMVDEVIKLDITPNSRYKDKYIVEMTDSEKAFNEATSVAFNIPLNQCTSIEQTRERIRSKMKDFTFPIWTVKYLLPGNAENRDSDSIVSIRTDRAVIEELIDDYCGIANNANMGTVSSDNSIATAIGNLCMQHTNAKDDLKRLLTKDNCTNGMRAYLYEFEGGALPDLGDEIGDGGQYINVLRSKFDANEANWVCNLETAQQKIREVILEYRIIVESNKIIPKNLNFANTIGEWCDICGNIRISFAAAKNYLGSLAPLMEMLHSIKRAGTILDSQKEKFLELLLAHGSDFNRFYNNQIDTFKEVCAYYLDGFADEEINAIFRNITGEVFTIEKAEYMNLVDRKVREFKNSLGHERLKSLWKEKTGTVSPRQWSIEHRMPVQYLVPDDEVTEAKKVFGTLNQKHPTALSIKKATEYLESKDEDFYNLFNDKKKLDEIFREKIIGRYSPLLPNIDEVKNYLLDNAGSEPFDWFEHPLTQKMIFKMADANYNRGGYKKALEKIESMDVADVKRYVKDLICDNMNLGIEIINDGL